MELDKFSREHKQMYVAKWGERGLLHGPREAEVCGGLLAARVAK